MGPLVFGVAVVVFARENGPISRLLKSKPAQRLGELSFSIYMVNELIAVVMSRVLKALGILLGHPFPVTHYTIGDVFLLRDHLIGDLAVTASCALILFVAGFAWKTVEVPCRTYIYGKARQLDRRSQAAAGRAALAP
jgi:peptidoglycan/LPS O-acetylase OafA/YrhL